jgi:hypothetical protein
MPGLDIPNGVQKLKEDNGIERVELSSLMWKCSRKLSLEQRRMEWRLLIPV